METTRKEFYKYCDELREKFDISIPLKFRDDILDIFIFKALEKQKSEIKTDLNSVVGMLEGSTDRQKIINFINEYLLNKK